MMIHACPGLGITYFVVCGSDATRRKNRFTEATPAGYNYPYNESPGSAFLEPPNTTYSPLAANAVASFCARLYMKTTSRTLVISPLFTNSETFGRKKS
jgi:hypothetical protein